MTEVARLESSLRSGFGTEDLGFPIVYVKFYKLGEMVPEPVLSARSDVETVMSCQATRHAADGFPVYLDIVNIGCVAAAISLGLVDQDQDRPLAGNRVYTCIMHEQTGFDPDFVPPSPKEFTAGVVYACEAEERGDYCLFGEEDSGRFKDRETAQKAVARMPAIQPPTMQGVFFYSSAFTDLDLRPDVAIMIVRPVELTRLIQGYTYLTGERVEAHLGPVRAVNSELIARPYLTDKMNVSSYCLGSRLVAAFEADRMGLGAPFEKFETIVRGVEASKGGYPFEKYPGALK